MLSTPNLPSASVSLLKTFQLVTPSRLPSHLKSIRTESTPVYWNFSSTFFSPCAGYPVRWQSEQIWSWLADRLLSCSVPPLLPIWSQLWLELFILFSISQPVWSSSRRCCPTSPRSFLLPLFGTCSSKPRFPKVKTNRYFLYLDNILNGLVIQLQTHFTWVDEKNKTWYWSCLCFKWKTLPSSVLLV